MTRVISARVDNGLNDAWLSIDGGDSLKNAVQRFQVLSDRLSYCERASKSPHAIASRSSRARYNSLEHDRVVRALVGQRLFGVGPAVHLLPQLDELGKSVRPEAE